jgi:hypothetical protein
MAVWKSVFLHEFLDGNPGNLHAVPGQLSVLPGGPVIGPTPAPPGFAISPGRSLGYQFARPFDNVVGVDLSVDILFPLQPGVQDFPLVALAGGRVTLSMGHLEFIDPGYTPETGRCRIALTVDGQVMEFDQLVVRHRQTTRFRVRWHTHGQGQIWHDGVLRAYEPGFAVGHSFPIDGILVGGPQGAPAAPSPHFLARRVYLKLVRRDDALGELVKHVPIDVSALPRTDCAIAARGLFNELLADMRKFMGESVLKLTASWREGQAHGPFSPEAVAAHDAAVGAAKAFAAFLDGRKQADAESFLKQATKFLNIIAATDRSRYNLLISELEERAERFDPACRAAMEPLRAANTATIKPFVRLLDATWERTKAAGSP